MNLTAIQNLMISTLNDFGDYVLIILSSVIGIAIAYYLFNFAWHLIQGTTFTGWAWLDRHTYKPWKGYNRFRSKKWNMERMELKEQKLSGHFNVAFKQKDALDKL
jgi:hypothetical protein